MGTLTVPPVPPNMAPYMQAPHACRVAELTSAASPAPIATAVVPLALGTPSAAATLVGAVPAPVPALSTLHAWATGLASVCQAGL